MFDMSRRDLSWLHSEKKVKCVDLIHHWTKFSLDCTFFPKHFEHVYMYMNTGKRKKPFNFLYLVKRFINWIWSGRWALLLKKVWCDGWPFIWPIIKFLMRTSSKVDFCHSSSRQNHGIFDWVPSSSNIGSLKHPLALERINWHINGALFGCCFSSS